MRINFILSMLIAFAATSIQAQTRPTVINPETGSEVNLTRAYWNPNVDIANRTLTCEWYGFDQNTGQSRQIDTPRTFTHNPLPANRPAINSAQIYKNGIAVNTDWGLTNPSRAWTVSDGIYSGPMPIYLSPFVEKIAHNSNNINAVRIWDDSYGSFICFDASGAPLLPTGSAGSGNTNLFNLADFTFEFPKAPAAGNPIPELYSLSTGEKIELVRGVWNYSDIANHSVTCTAQSWNGSDYVRAPDYATNVYFPSNNGSTVAVSSIGQDIERWQISDMTVTDITLPSSSRFNLPFMELTDKGYRMWGSENNSFYECAFRSLTTVTGSGKFESESVRVAPATVLPLGEGNCDYRDALQYNGWGWNPVTRTSCPPITTPAGNCVYTAALSNNGWGWNPVTMQSCPPKDAPACVDTDGDGYGWNGTETCIP